MTKIDDKVMHDAALMLEKAARELRRIFEGRSVVGRETRDVLLSSARANVNAAMARIEHGE